MNRYRSDSICPSIYLLYNNSNTDIGKQGRNFNEKSGGAEKPLL